MKLWAFCITLKLLWKLCSSTQVQVVPGSTLELPCFSFPTDLSGMAISWKFNGDEITSRDTVKTNATHLSISPVSAADRGEYVCSVIDPDVNVEMRRTYNVIVEASISYTLLVGESTNARLPCHFSPDYQIQTNALWFRETAGSKREAMFTRPDGTGSEDGRAELLYLLDHDQTMTLRDVSADDQGLYHCDSPEGVTLSTVRLILASVPTPPPHSCQGMTSAWEACDEDHSRTAGPVLRESLAEFAFKLYPILQESNPQRNLLYSPISINGALAHLLLGARNKTRTDLEAALCLPPMFHCVHSEMNRLREHLSYSFQMGSQIFYNTKTNLSASFLAQSAEFYVSKPEKLRDNSEENARMINSWVANQTRNKITHLVKSVSENTQLMLLNAVSFSGMWIIKFNNEPMKRHFTKLNGDMVNVPVLRNDKFLGSMVYAAGLKAQVMRFGLTGNNSLYVLLPQTYRAADLQQVESRLTDQAVREMVNQVKRAIPQHLEVTLPKIKLNVEQDLSVPMKKLGTNASNTSSLLNGEQEYSSVTQDGTQSNNRHPSTGFALQISNDLSLLIIWIIHG